MFKKKAPERKSPVLFCVPKKLDNVLILPTIKTSNLYLCFTLKIIEFMFYVILIAVIVLYALIALIVSTMIEPKHPALFYIINLFQLVMITMPFFVWKDEMSSFVSIVYGVIVYTIWLLQFLSIRNYNIVPGKVYECEYYGFVPKYDEPTAHLGLIREGLFTTGVIIEGYDPNADGDFVEVVFDEKISKEKGGEAFEVCKDFPRCGYKEVFTVYVVKAKT